MMVLRLPFILTCLVIMISTVAACAAPPPAPPTAESAVLSTMTLPDSSPTSQPTTNTPVPPTVTPTVEPVVATSAKEFTLATSAEDVLGTWRERGDYIRFDEDGTFHQAHGMDQLDDHPYAICSYQFEGTEMIITEISVSGVPPCEIKTGRYEIRMLENGDIKIVVIEDQCPPRAGDISGVKAPAESPTP